LIRRWSGPLRGLRAQPDLAPTFSDGNCPVLVEPDATAAGAPTDCSLDSGQPGHLAVRLPRASSPAVETGTVTGRKPSRSCTRPPSNARTLPGVSNGSLRDGKPGTAPALVLVGDVPVNALDVSIHGGAVTWCQVVAGNGGSQGFPAMALLMASSAVMPWAAAESR
jgi:hypothetical protein